MRTFIHFFQVKNRLCFLLDATASAKLRKKIAKTKKNNFRVFALLPGCIFSTKYWFVKPMRLI